MIDWRTTGARIHGPHWHSVIADVYKHANRIPEGLQAIEDALSEAEKTGEASCLSEIHRINGKLHHAAGQPEREAIHTAIEIARQAGNHLVRTPRDH